MFQDLIANDPVVLYELLRDDPALLVQFVREDSEPPLTKWFEPAPPGWSHDPRSAGRFGPLAAGVEWVYLGVHAQDWVFNGIRATGKRVTVRGCSIVAVEGGQFRLRRYIDWVGLYAQLGLAMNWRVPVEAPPEPLEP